MDLPGFLLKLAGRQGARIEPTRGCSLWSGVGNGFMVANLRSWILVDKKKPILSNYLIGLSYFVRSLKSDRFKPVI